MSSLKADFDELRERIRYGRELGHASFEPIYYLVFPPDQILEVKRQTPAWVSKLRQEGWNVHTFSIAEQIWELLKDDPLWSLCITERSVSTMAGASKLAEGWTSTRNRGGRFEVGAHDLSLRKCLETKVDIFRA